MFNLLKEKLKGWVSKAEDETEIVDEIKKKNKSSSKEKENKKDKKVNKNDSKKDDNVDKKKETKDDKKPDKKISKEKEIKKINEKGVEEKFSLKEERKLKKEIKKQEKLESKNEIKKNEEELKEEDIESEKEEDENGKTKKSLFKRKGLTENKFYDLFEELELILMQNNVSYEAVDCIKEILKEKLVGENNVDINESLKEAINEILINPPNLVDKIKEKKGSPFVILFAGINGAGKTTSIAKVAYMLKKEGFSVCVAAADTFRAASIEQLQVHADKLEISLIKKGYGSDPASVGFDAVKYAQKHKIDVVLIDTAGRMNNRDSLMKEIEKISRVNSPDLKIFLGESITGNDATQQAKDFNEAIGIDGIILSKADVDEKGGTAISVSKVTGKPIYFLGVGQNYEDLEVFDKEKLISRMF